MLTAKDTKEARMRAAVRVDDAARALKLAAKVLDGDSFGDQIEAMSVDAKQIADRLREYAANGW